MKLNKATRFTFPREQHVLLFLWKIWSNWLLVLKSSSHGTTENLFIHSTLSYPPYLNVELNIIFSPTSLTSDVRNIRSHHDKELRFTKLLFKILLFYNFWFDALHMRNSSIWLGDCFCILIVDIAPTGTRSQASTSTHEGSLILATEKF